MVRTGISPEINAVSTLLLAATSLLLFAAYRLEQGRSARARRRPGRRSASAILATPFVLGGRAAAGEKVLNLYIWSNYISPETVKKFEERHGVHVNVDLYDTNEAMLAKVADRATWPTTSSARRTTRSRACATRTCCCPLDHSALPHLTNIDPRFLDQPYDPGNRYSVPYFWGTAASPTTRSAWARSTRGRALWDARCKGRVLMLDDPRETIGAALKWKGKSFNTTDPAKLADRAAAAASSRSRW